MRLTGTAASTCRGQAVPAEVRRYTWCGRCRRCRRSGTAATDSRFRSAQTDPPSCPGLKSGWPRATIALHVRPRWRYERCGDDGLVRLDLQVAESGADLIADRFAAAPTQSRPRVDGALGPLQRSAASALNHSHATNTVGTVRALRRPACRASRRADRSDREVRRPSDLAARC